MAKIAGIVAIEYAAVHGLPLSKYSDPIEGARENLTVDEAREIAREDPALIYVDDSLTHCDCGAWSGESCAWAGPVTETVIVEYMPEQHRSSHQAAGNAGSYPHNGAERVRVHSDCAKFMVEHDADWCSIVEGA